MKSISLVLAMLASAAMSDSQNAAGVVNYTPPVAPSTGTPGKVVLTAGSVTCTITGNAEPATVVLVSCTVNGVAIPAYTMPIASGQAYTFQQNFSHGGTPATFDAVTFSVSSAASGLAWQAAATPAGGTAASGNGTL